MEFLGVSAKDSRLHLFTIRVSAYAQWVQLKDDLQEKVKEGTLTKKMALEMRNKLSRIG